MKKIESEKLIKLILRRIGLVKGDFRQEKISEKWQDFFENVNRHTFQVAEIKVNCGSGTYVRSLAKEIGHLLGVPALALTITRTKIY